MSGNSQLDDLVALVSKKLGTDPEKLKKAAQSGRAQETLKNLESKESQKLKQILSDKEATAKLLSTPKAQQLLKKLLGEK